VISLLEQYFIHLIKNPKLENLCLESDNKKNKWIFSCYIGKAYDKKSQEVWVEGDSPFQVLEEAIVFISRYMRGCHVGNNKKSKWEKIKQSSVNTEELIRQNGEEKLSFV